MVTSEGPDRLSTTLAALADPTRRAILARLASGESSVTELAKPFRMSLPAVSKHLKVLERAGLIARSRSAQWRPCKLDAGPMREAAAWLDGYRRFWDESFERLDDYLIELTAKENDVVESANARAEQPDMTIVRTFDAPRDLVWKAWTDAEHLARWFGPKGFTNPVYEIDGLRPGGTMNITMQAPDGTQYPMVAVYDEVVEPERLVWTTHVDHGENVSFQIRQVTAFAERDGKTEVTLQAFVLRSTPESADALGGMEEGWSQSLDRLDALLARN